MKTILKLLLSLSLIGCHNSPKHDISIPPGGYPFPKSYAAGDFTFFFYPIKDILSTRDSFNIRNHSQFLFTAFNEPNLSLKPPPHNVYRFVYYMDFINYQAILRLEDSKMIIKELRSGDATPYVNKDKLTSVEQENLHYIESYYLYHDKSSVTELYFLIRCLIKSQN